MLDLFPEYIMSVKNLGWDKAWGPAVLCIAYCLSWFRATPPPWYVTMVFICGLIMIVGYHLWRADHIRLIPKLKISETRFQDTPVTYGGLTVDQRTFVQLIPECLTDAPVYECVGYLQKIEKSIGEDQWEELPLDRNLILNWGAGKVELHPKSEIPLNVFFVQRDTKQVIPAIKRDADIPVQKFDTALMKEPILRFYVQITCCDRVNGHFESIPPVGACVEVRFVGPNKLRPQVNLISAPTKKRNHENSTL